MGYGFLSIRNISYDDFWYLVGGVFLVWFLVVFHYVVFHVVSGVFFFSLGVVFHLQLGHRGVR